MRLFDFFHNICDYEHIAILLVLTILFIIGLKKLPQKKQCQGFVLDRDFSGALKGIGAVMILMGHFAVMQIGYSEGDPKSINWIVSWSTANIALVWFMFISGYGLTVSKKTITNHFITGAIRISKVFLPMLFVFVVSLLLYAILPYPYTEETVRALAIPAEIGMIPNDIAGNIVFIGGGIIRWYWYPWCAIMLYVCYYVADYISSKFQLNKSWTLLFVLALYYIGAFMILGPSLAHYYRLVWAFFFGHLFVRWVAQPKWQTYTMALIALSTFAFEGKFMILSFIIAIAVILISSKLNKQYEFQGKWLINLGVLSYFYYLCHRRIVWPVMCEFDCHDVLVWSLISLIVAFVLHAIYYKLKSCF